MSNSRADQLLRLLQTLDRRTQTEDDAQAMSENTIQDLFFPISEKLSLADIVEVATYTPSTFCWGDGSAVSAGWDWNGGGKWNA